MDAVRAVAIAVLVVLSMTAVPLSAATVDVHDPTATDIDREPVGESIGIELHGEDHVTGERDGSGATAYHAQVHIERGTYVGDDDQPSTQGTIGYVEGVRYDDSLPIDEREGAVVPDDELDDVVYRAMARVEVLRELPFEDEVPIEVISREDFERDSAERFAALSAEERYVENVRLEALFKVDRETDAVDEFETLYGGAVAGYYDPEADQIVLVSDSPDEPELNEVILGHELLHALQDQHFGLDRYDRSTQDRAAATNGLIEGDAVLIETAYDERCSDDWSCVEPTSSGAPTGDVNDGLLLALLQPYIDGPAYVEALREEGGWDAVDAAYDDPPTTSSAVIRPGDDRETVSLSVTDTSSEAWERYEIDGEPVNEVVGEAGMAAKFMHQTLEYGIDSPISHEEVGGTLSPYQYDHNVTDGWAGDVFVPYTADDERIEESGYVWKSAWTSEADAEAFLDGYIAVLEGHGGHSVDGYQNTILIRNGDGYPGAYYIDHDGDQVTIVRAPSVSDLSEIHADAAPEGEDTIDLGLETTDEGESEATDSSSRDEDPISGFGTGAAMVAIITAAVAVTLSLRFGPRQPPVSDE